MKINILTIFPEMFTPITGSMLGRAADKGILEFHIADIREYTEDKHRRVDDTPYGGGAGMILQAQPILSAARANSFAGRCVYMSPKGKILTGEIAEELANEKELTILCGHYEGVDERAIELLGAEEISIGDYVLTGGELPAMVLIDAVARFIGGVLAGEESVRDESIYSGLIESPHYTRPREYEGLCVPEVLLGGNHKQIDLWKFEESVRLTAERRPDLLLEFAAENRELTKEEKQILDDRLHKVGTQST